MNAKITETSGTVAAVANAAIAVLFLGVMVKMCVDVVKTYKEENVTSQPKKLFRVK